MKRTEFYDSVEKARQEAYETNVAKKIIDQLKKLRFSNNENSAKRWIWELCQNAKDVCNLTGKVKIRIYLDKEKKKIFFFHNGKAFTTENLVYLIEQVSTKDRTMDGDDRKSGKFGTGFLTTHLLSETVKISGLVIDRNKDLAHFCITLDRTGRTKSEIIESIHRSIEQLNDFTSVDDWKIVDQNDYNTVFEYDLDDNGLEVAMEGLKNLRISAPYVLSMLHDIEEIRIDPIGDVYAYKTDYDCELKNAAVYEIESQINEEKQKSYILNLTEENVTISVMFDEKEGNIIIKPYDKEQPKLFCDFPLVGTDDFPFPVIISSPYFNPTEPRDGIFLTSKSKIEEEIKENRQILVRGCELYKCLLQYVSRKSWRGIYNITKLDRYEIKEWYDDKWIKDKIVDVCKKTILSTAIIENCKNERIEIEDLFGDTKALIVSNHDNTVRTQLWELGSALYPEEIPCCEEFHDWYNSLWSKCRNFTFQELTNRLNGLGNIDKLSLLLGNNRWSDWLENYYRLAQCNKEFVDLITNNQVAVVPNQNGDFCRISELAIDDNVLIEYKELLNFFGEDCKKWLIHLQLPKQAWFSCRYYHNSDILKAIETAVDSANKKQLKDIYFNIIQLSTSNYKEIEQQKKIIEFASAIFKTDITIKYVEIVSDKLLENGSKYIMTSIADYISECKSIDKLAGYVGIENKNMLRWLSDFIEFAVANRYGNLIEKSTKPILPNQNGVFVVKDNLFLDDEMDDTLKDLARFSGYDVRKELLAKEIYLKLPENRTKRDEDLSLCIIQYVKKHKGSDLEEVKKCFSKLLLWINDNDDKAKRIFEELYDKKYYLYDDKEIAKNIRKAEAFDTLMQKYDISDPEKLEDIIRQSQINSDKAFIETKEEVTEEVLLQCGIDSEHELSKAFSNKMFADNFVRETKQNSSAYEYVRQILERSKNRIFKYLSNKDDYDLSNLQKVAPTVFIIKKGKEEIYLLARPSDRGEIRLYYETEKDILDYSKDWELWVEDGKNDPEKITFGRMIKLTGINRIPLTRIKEIR
ncbi:sacsin N-terminal ATP-binding-like domain-containing protein [Clostridium tyrobutyricum]|uniref:sacsin N-terminal ATP-binding-like domain-containing protein n=1 Tax=Clostridium tyrobutyricum TaxID=1519 RepID=UPI002B1F102D|nr:hypothetical protein [Clostridium tyrobutyricum]